MINLYVDDTRPRPEGFILAKTAEEAIKIIDSENIEILSLDHDLGTNRRGQLLPTGYDLVKYICEYWDELNISKIYIHSSNPIGRENMYRYLLSALRANQIYGVEVFPYKYK